MNTKKNEPYNFPGEKISLWISKIWKALFVGFICAIFVTPIIIYCGYKYIPGEIVIEPGDLLGYIGSSFIGIATFFLSICVFLFDRDKLLRKEVNFRLERRIRAMRSVVIKRRDKQFFIENDSENQIVDVTIYECDDGSIVQNINRLKSGESEALVVSVVGEDISVSYRNSYDDLLHQMFDYVDGEYQLKKCEWLD